MPTDQAEFRSPSPTDSIERAVQSVRNFSRSVWLDLVRRDQSERWRRGCGIGAEKYFELLPELRENPEDALVLVCGEAHLRREKGDLASLLEYQQRFPQIAEGLKLQFELDEVIGYSSAAAIDDQPTNDPSAAEPCGLDLPGMEILRELGRGESGIVYLARQVSIDRLVAVKAIALSATDTGRLRRQRQEAAILSRMQHPHVVQIHDVIEAGGMLFSVIEYVDGPTLGEFAGGKPLAPREAARLVRILADALHTVHEAGILHRDLKPSNVLMTPLGEPKITDFGLAKLLATDNRLTTENCLLGTPSYMPPEQASGNGGSAARQGDVYSLGAILYELLTGRPPFLGVTVLDTLSLIRARDPVPPRTSQPRTPRDLETICLKCLEKSPLERYPTAAALAADLERFMQGGPICARRPAWHEKTWRWCRRKPAVATLAASLLVAVLAGFAGVLWQWRQAEVARVNESVARRDADDRAAEIKVGFQRQRDSLALLERGRVFSTFHRWADAMNAVSAAIELRPDYAPAWEDRSRLYSHLCLWELATADARRAFELNPPAQTTHWWSHGTLLAQSGDVQGYREFCDKMKQRFHGHGRFITFDVARTCCILEDSQADYSSFLESMRGADPVPPEYPLLSYILGLVHYRAGQFQEAVRCCSDSTRFGPAWAEQPLNFPVLALAFNQLGDAASARQNFELATQARDRWIQQLYGDGASASEIGKGATANWAVFPWVWLEFDILYREAARHLNYPPLQDDPRWFAIRARVLAAIRRYDAADAEYQSAIEWAPQDDRIRMERHRAAAYHCVRRKDFAQAAIEFAAAAQLQPGDAALLEMRADAHLAAGDVDQYRNTCNELLEQFRSTNDPLMADRIVRACLSRPDVVFELAELLSLANVAAAAYPGSGRTKAAVLVRAGQYEDAVRCFQEAAMHRAPNPWDWSFQAIAYFHLDRMDESRRCLENAARWIEQADRRSLPDADFNLPAWGNWSWNERLHSVRLFAEARSLVAPQHTGD